MSYIDYISLFYAFNTLHIYVCICLFLDLYNFIVSNHWKESKWFETNDVDFEIVVVKEADIVDGEEEEVREQIIGLVEEEVVAKVLREEEDYQSGGQL